ncbi:6539_t:CDS:1 [Acaulospora colombiana]|uniref:6539_t:CDS:1 n=1 Tax=Acaulospora colombiana TaxID=27376 RepID=A0ACA9KEW7_9GLOM|nr:6539_t:CDS:1 [Acaulospora colombiana]
MTPPFPSQELINEASIIYEQIPIVRLAGVRYEDGEEYILFGNEVNQMYFLYYSHNEKCETCYFDIPSLDSLASRKKVIDLHFSKAGLKKYNATSQKRPATGYILFRQQLSHIFKSLNLAFTWQKVSHISKKMWTELSENKSEMIGIMRRVYDSALRAHNIGQPFHTYIPHTPKQTRNPRQSKKNVTRKQSSSFRSQNVEETIPSIPWNQFKDNALHPVF